MPSREHNLVAAPAPEACTNQLLAALPVADYTRLRSMMERVCLRPQQVLYEPGEVITHVYFPTTAVVALLILAEDGMSVGTVLVGNDGVVGLPLSLGLDCDTNRAMGHVTGAALRVAAETFRAALSRDEALRDVLQRYTQVLLVRLGQAAACNQLHSVRGRLTRWLLETRDRAGGDEFLLTQESMAALLAVRRATVSEAAATLQEGGLIRYHRGRVTILDHARLEGAACECYRTLADTTARLLGSARRPPS